MRHDFGPRFLRETYRNLVINDLIDLLAPGRPRADPQRQGRDYHDAVDRLPEREGDIAPGDHWVADAGPAPRGLEQDEAPRQDQYIGRDQRQAAMERRKNLKFLAICTRSAGPGRGPTRSPRATCKRVFVAQNLLNLALRRPEALDLGELATSPTPRQGPRHRRRGPTSATSSKPPTT